MEGLVTGPGASLSPAFWRACWATLDAVWPDISGRVARAEALGAPWAPVTTPFAWVEEGRVLAHVGVLAHPVRLDGVDRVVGGVHAVCSHPDARGRGLVRRLMEHACEHLDAKYDAAKLHTDHPDLYAKWGFRVEPTWRWTTPVAVDPGAAPARPLTLPADAAHLRAAYRARVPVSDRFASRDDGWLALIDAALARRLDDWFWRSPAGDWIVAWAREGDALVVDDVVAAALPSLDALLAAVPWPVREVRWSFPPDRFDPAASPTPVPVHEGVLQVRGAWPVGCAIGVSPVAEH